MAPGPLTSSARSGYSFSRSQAFAPRITSFSRASTVGASYTSARPFGATRDLGQRQRFAVGDSAEVVLGPEETLIVTVEDDPDDAPPVDSAPMPDDAPVTESYRRPRSRGLVVHGHPDGSLPGLSGPLRASLRHRRPLALWCALHVAFRIRMFKRRSKRDMARDGSSTSPMVWWSTWSSQRTRRKSPARRSPCRNCHRWNCRCTRSSRRS
jgi:hypothetical protein